MATLETAYPDIAREWSEKNLPLTPADVAPKGNAKVWWKGVCGHEWKTRIADRTDGHGCPYCENNKLLTGFNDLATKMPALSAEWSKRNEPLRPDKVKPKSRQNVWWTCSRCNNEWRAVINSRVLGQRRCPVCEKKKRAAEIAWKYDKPFKTRMVEEAVAYYAAQAGFTVHRHTDPGIGLPINVYLPEIRAAFEVSRKGRTWREETIKNDLCWRAKIRMIRVAEQNAVMYENCKCIRRRDGTLESLNEALETVFMLWGIPMETNVERDIKAIHLEYRERNK